MVREARSIPARRRRVSRSRETPGRTSSRPGLTAVALVLLVAFVALVAVRATGSAIHVLRWLLLPVPMAVEPQSPPVHDDTGLRAAIFASVPRANGTLSVDVQDLRGGASASIDADREFVAASLFKVPILVEVLRQEELGELEPARLLEIKQSDWTDGSGVLQDRVGDRLSVDELTRLMIEKSDNIAALVLLDAVGVDSVNATSQSLGLTGTRLIDRHLDPNGAHMTTAADMARLFDLAASGTLIDAHVSDQALRLLGVQQANTWLAEALPWWIRVAHKWGDLPPVRHDAGVVYGPNSTYAIAVLTDGMPPLEAEQAIAAVSRAAYDYLN